jgi:hypothetical protein
VQAMAVDRQWLSSDHVVTPTETTQQWSNWEVFSMRSVPRGYKQDQLAVAVRELLRLGRCDLFLLEAGS